MTSRIPFLLLSVTAAVVLIPCEARAQRQQVTVTTPLQGVSDRFYESNNVGFSFGVGSGANVRTFGRVGSPPVAPPRFGGFNPNAGIQGGFGVNKGGFGANFRFGFSQGSQRTHTTTAPKITLMNGQPGFLFNGRQRPFVTGLVPVVGGGGLRLGHPGQSSTPAARVLRGEVALPPRRSRQSATADSGQRASSGPSPLKITAPQPPSEIRRQQAEARAESQSGARNHFNRGLQAETAGKPQVAKVYYRLAAKKANGELKQQILARIDRLKDR